jgi:hypothetical protein
LAAFTSLTILVNYYLPIIGRSAQRMKNSNIAIISTTLAVLSPAIVSPNVLKTVWVMFRYGEPKYMAGGMTVALLIAFWASRRMRLSIQVALLVPGILPLWIAMYLTADSGYRNWQGSANAPAQAYADTGPIFFLIAGWLPSWGMAYLLLILFQRIFPRPPVSPPPLPSNPR